MEYQRPILVGITGGTASGKTSVCEIVYEQLGGLKGCTLLPMDCFYKELTDLEMQDVGKYNFDHPDAFDWPLITETLQQLLSRQDVIIPNYNYSTCKRDAPGIELKATNLILFEGIFALFDKQVRDWMDLKVFVHSDDDIRLLRRLKRDVLHRGRTVEGVLKSYNRFVKAAYDEYIKPTMKYSDIIVPRGAENVIAISFITENLRNRMINIVPVKQQQSEVVAEKIIYKQLPFKLVEEDILVKTQICTAVMEKIVLKILNEEDIEMMPVTMQYLSSQLHTLFKSHNPTYNATQWQYLNNKEETNNHNVALADGLCNLVDSEECKHLLVFIPSITSNREIDRIKQLGDTLRQLSYMHSIESVHILSYFNSMHETILKDFQSQQNSMFFYTLYLSEDLSKYSQFRESIHLHHHKLMEDDDIDIVAQSSEEKIKAFKELMNNGLDVKGCYQSFYE